MSEAEKELAVACKVMSDLLQDDERLKAAYETGRLAARRELVIPRERTEGWEECERRDRVDLGYSAVAIPYRSSLLPLSHDIPLVDFDVFQIVNERGGSILWRSEGMTAGQDPETDDQAQAEVFISGHVKWDGCSNWNIGSDGVMLHFCSVRQAERLGELLRWLYEWADEMMHHTDTLR